MAEDDGVLVIGAILGLVAVAALGTSATAGSSSSSAHSSSSSSSHASATATPHPSATSTPTTPPSSATTPRCTAVATATSHQGGSYTRYPVSSAGSTHCYLQQGDTGLPVATLQRAMALCMCHPLVTDGIYGPLTAGAVAAVGQTGPVYGPVTAGRMKWPWYSSTTTKFTGTCSSL
ncbi:MAG TPA: hypothetical protein VMT69_14280 [Kineosporiaceae bacterium]|nr:hypothetical protein [Kineosporiaceae bacterium]